MCDHCSMVVFAFSVRWKVKVEKIRDISPSENCRNESLAPPAATPNVSTCELSTSGLSACNLRRFLLIHQKRKSHFDAGVASLEFCSHIEQPTIAHSRDLVRPHELWWCLTEKRYCYHCQWCFPRRQRWHCCSAYSIQYIYTFLWVFSKRKKIFFTWTTSKDETHLWEERCQFSAKRASACLKTRENNENRI